MKKFLIVVTVLLLIIAAALATVYFFRNKIIQQSMEYALRKALPDYIMLDSIEFDMKRHSIIARGFAVSNAKGFSEKHFLKVPKIICKFRNKGKTLLDGLVFFDFVMMHPSFVIERDRRGRLNILQLQKEIEEVKTPLIQAETSSPAEPSQKTTGAQNPTQRLSDLITIPKKFPVRGGRVLFIDYMPYDTPYTISLDNIDATMGLTLNQTYSEILKVTFNGSARLNGKAGQTIEWVVSLDPKTPKLTMSNRYMPNNLDLTVFAPYIEQHTPFKVRKGYFTGTLVIDFDNGQVGSTNKIELRHLDFSIKPGYENYTFAGVQVSDLAAYLAKGEGNVLFDFKIKGQPDNLKFFLGPISKRALSSAVIESISDVISGGKKPESADEAVEQIMNLIKGLRK